ncbi:cell division cycle protein 123 homolog [Eurytemora carolleeae]|uniref:cell division cycle protein 123 homolog n=1 Tax=Eurytemora carolleeae TaxID=1294199 RepID=UPI000C77EAB5|nr:cell division cycle protein 123 homolog [Eurytemora carolleeae]|eukprot:XP_023334114.1 cell division cycle protein 123 homolog [Eurytemora affinis]
MLTADVLNCSFPNWYTTFEKVTIPSTIIPLPEPVLEYLLEDAQLVLPVECNSENMDGVEDDYEDFGDINWEENTVSSELQQKSFSEFSRKITESLREMGGQMFIKLNWSSPKDATWIVFNNSLRCSSLSQLYLLLKSSDFIVHDLTRPFKFCIDEETVKPSVQYSLILRNWLDVNPGSEFRCFVKEEELIAICQRDNSNYYDHIAIQQESIKQDIISFFREHIKNKFPSADFVFDVIRTKKDKVILVDFNPFGETTEALFFSWDELRDSSLDLEFRFATDSSGVQPHPYRHYSIPQDFVDLSSGTDPNKLIDFINLKNRTEEQRQDSDSD